MTSAAAPWPGRFPYDAVSFDIDGTLYRLRPFKWRLVWRRWRDLGAWLAMEDVRRTLRRLPSPPDDLDDAILQRVAARLRRPPEDTAPLLQRMIHHDWPALLAAVGPAPGTLDALDALERAGIPYLAFSDYPGDAKLAGLGLAGRPWRAVLDATALGALKPHPAPFRAAAQALGLPPERVLHVGDSLELDIRGAHAAGLPSLLLGRSKPPPGPPVAPTWRLPSMAAFARALNASLTQELPP